eukprot:jgi/Astpho2/9659/Aster-x0406
MGEAGPGTDLYRRGKLGDSLVSALEHFIDNERISPDLALKVLAELPQQAIRRHLEMSDKPSGTFKGNLESYRFCDSVWNFVVQNAEFKLHVPGESMNIMVDVPKLHVVALDQKTLDPSVPGNG